MGALEKLKENDAFAMQTAELFDELSKGIEKQYSDPEIYNDPVKQLYSTGFCIEDGELTEMSVLAINHDYHFVDKNGLNTIVIPKSVKSIGPDMLEKSRYNGGNFDKIDAIVLPEGIETIKDRAFALNPEQETFAHVKTVNIPDSTSYIAEDAFSNNVFLVDINISDKKLLDFDAENLLKDTSVDKQELRERTYKAIKDYKEAVLSGMEKRDQELDNNDQLLDDPETKIKEPEKSVDPLDFNDQILDDPSGYELEDDIPIDDLDAQNTIEDEEYDEYDDEEEEEDFEL